MTADMRTPRAARQVADCRPVAALYIDPRGPYPKMAYGPEELFLADGLVSAFDPLHVDCWDESRDARKYDGPHPIVAHPPCGPWGRLRHLYKGSEHDCAPRAVEQVRRWGGVLEHPAGSLLWHNGRPCPNTASGAHCEHAAEDGGPCCKCGWEHLPYSDHAEDSFGGYTIEVDQCEWGHVARKRTWLYLVGVPREALEAPPFPDAVATHRVTNGSRGRTELPRCSAFAARATPPLFAEYLVRLARAAVKP